MATVMLIHGMFLNPESWREWQGYFRERGFDTVAPAWPLHDGDPAQLRAAPPAALGSLSLQDVVDAIARSAAAYDDLILIGHSVGGLLVQLLAAKGIGVAAIAICPVAPNRMLSLDWGFFRNSVAITNPLAGDEIFPMDADGFFKNFGNTMERADSDAAWQAYAVPDSRNVFRGCMTDVAKVDVGLPHVPFLFIGAAEDEIIPAHLVERNAAAYTDPSSRADYMKFSGRGHFICGQPGWQDVASYAANWLQEVATVEVSRAVDIKPD